MSMQNLGNDVWQIGDSSPQQDQRNWIITSEATGVKIRLRKWGEFSSMVSYQHSYGLRGHIPEAAEDFPAGYVRGNFFVETSTLSAGEPSPGFAMLEITYGTQQGEASVSITGSTQIVSETSVRIEKNIIEAPFWRSAFGDVARDSSLTAMDFVNAAVQERDAKKRKTIWDAARVKFPATAQTSAMAQMYDVIQTGQTAFEVHAREFTLEERNLQSKPSDAGKDCDKVFNPPVSGYTDGLQWRLTRDDISKDSDGNWTRFRTWQGAAVWNPLTYPEKE